MGSEVVLIAIGVLAVIWIVVLWGSRYFGPQ
jgi:diacylglycerol kinase